MLALAGFVGRGIKSASNSAAAGGVFLRRGQGGTGVEAGGRGGGLGRADDGGVHAVGDRVRRGEFDVGETGTGEVPILPAVLRCLGALEMPRVGAEGCAEGKECCTSASFAHHAAKGGRCRYRQGGMRLLVVGGSGYLGREVVRQAGDGGQWVAATYRSRPRGADGGRWLRLDLSDPARIDAVLDRVRPDVVVNTASGGADWAATAEGPVRLAMATARKGIGLVHVSSDAVFSGSRPWYGEDSRPDPLTPYGAAKAAAENGVLLVHPQAAVARTSLILGDGGSEHERAVHALAAGGEGVLFTDDVRCPVHVSDLAAGLLELAVSGTGGMRHLVPHQAMFASVLPGRCGSRGARSLAGCTLI